MSIDLLRKEKKKKRKENRYWLSHLAKSWQVVDNLFQIVGLTIMVVMEKEEYVDLLYSMHEELLLFILSKICYMEHGGSLCCQGSDYISKLNNSYYF